MPTSSPGKRKLLVGNLPEALGALELESQMASYFSTFGPIESAHIQCDAATQRHFGFGSITFQQESSLDRALAEPHNYEGVKLALKRFREPVRDAPASPQRPHGELPKLEAVVVSKKPQLMTKPEAEGSVAHEESNSMSDDDDSDAFDVSDASLASEDDEWAEAPKDVKSRDGEGAAQPQKCFEVISSERLRLKLRVCGAGRRSGKRPASGADPRAPTRSRPRERERAAHDELLAEALAAVPEKEQFRLFWAEIKRAEAESAAGASRSPLRRPPMRRRLASTALGGEPADGELAARVDDARPARHVLCLGMSFPNLAPALAEPPAARGGAERALRASSTRCLESAHERTGATSRASSRSRCSTRSTTSSRARPATRTRARAAARRRLLAYGVSLVDTCEGRADRAPARTARRLQQG